MATIGEEERNAKSLVMTARNTMNYHNDGPDKERIAIDLAKDDERVLGVRCMLRRILVRNGMDADSWKISILGIQRKLTKSMTG